MGHKDAQTRRMGDRGLTTKENVLPQLDYIVTNIKRYAQKKKLVRTHCACIKRGHRRSRGRLHGSEPGAKTCIESFSTDKGQERARQTMTADDA